MKTLSVRVVVLMLVISGSFSQDWATWGEAEVATREAWVVSARWAGAGIMGEPVDNVPRRVRVPEAPPVTEGLVVYWFPSSVQEVQRSGLRISRTPSLYASQCVAMEIVYAVTPRGQKLVPGAKLPIAVLPTPDGTLIGKAEKKNGSLRVFEAEKLVDEEIQAAGESVDSQPKDAKGHVKSGDNAGAIPFSKAMLEQKCLLSRVSSETMRSDIMNKSVVQFGKGGTSFPVSARTRRRG
jgi:hypothetical protein